METERFVIFTGWWPEGAPSGALPVIAPGDFVACADSGYTVCAGAGIAPDVVIGDFDSLSEIQVLEIDALGVERITYPSEKDDTDTMLCAKYGAGRGYGRFLVVGGIGGGFGHTMSNLQALSYLNDMGCEGEIVTPDERIMMVGGDRMKPECPLMVKGAAGSKFSVLSYTERSTGVFVGNAKYLLHDAVLTQSNPVGVSNEFINESPATVSVRNGRLLVISDRS